VLHNQFVSFVKAPFLRDAEREKTEILSGDPYGNRFLGIDVARLV
jgi:hypothetical protein